MISYIKWSYRRQTLTVQYHSFTLVVMFAKSSRIDIPRQKSAFVCFWAIISLFLVYQYTNEIFDKYSTLANGIEYPSHIHIRTDTRTYGYRLRPNETCQRAMQTQYLRYLRHQDRIEKCR